MTQACSSDQAIEFGEEQQRLKLVYGNLPLTLLGSFGAACILVALLETAVSWIHRGVWLIVGAIITGLRYANYRRYCLSLQRADASFWRRTFEIGTAASGVWWGYGGAGLFPAGDFESQAFIGFLLAGLGASAHSTYAGMPRAYFLFLGPAITPFIVRLLFEGSGIHYSMAALTTMYLGAVAYSALQTTRMIRESLRIRAENIALNSELHHQATHDHLTDLVNAREFHDRLMAASKVAAERHEPYALLFVDLDHFKEINDTAGHAMGDEALRQVAKLLKEQIRSSDTAARIGGDEFAILLLGCPRERAARHAEKILAAVQKLAEESKNGIFSQLGASIGVAYINAGEHDHTVVLLAADQACYAAKRDGRNRFQMYHADPKYQSSGRFILNTAKGK